MAASAHPPVTEVEITALADHLVTVFEVAFILARATGDPSKLRRQLAQLRTYLALLFDIVPSDRRLDPGSGSAGAPQELATAPLGG